MGEGAHKFLRGGDTSMKPDKDKNKFKADDTKPRRKGVGSFARMVKAEIKDINCKERWI